MSDIPTISNALVINSYGPPSVLQWTQITTPTIQSPHDVLIRVHATSVNPVEWKTRNGDFRLIFPLMAGFPHILGKDFSGTIVAVGSKISKFQVNDEVFGTVMDGAYSEYLIVNVETDGIEKKPRGLTHSEAAGVSIAALSAWGSLVDLGGLPVVGVNDGKNAEGSESGKPKVLIIGASGGVGTFAVQLAKVANNAHVTAICSAKNVALVTSLGADSVIDYTTQDYASVLALNHHETFDLVVDLVGQEGTYSKTSPLLKKTGIYVEAENEYCQENVSATDLLKFGFSSMIGRNFFGPRRSKNLFGVNQKDLRKIMPYLESGKVKTVVWREVPLSDGAKAHELSETKRAVGKIIMTVL
ncbi:13006_t:CDS:1 [Ambispora gerdemannii]|uniref:13006_t:CDS:1 n=1 Tax=Ambispora gerdemannii TaxID=144530 RepID=A0A9N9FM53_9GLOM|nr:13006_t:CDS:1 [Ambispora gerdemannii]